MQKVKVHGKRSVLDCQHLRRFKEISIINHVNLLYQEKSTITFQLSHGRLVSNYELLVSLQILIRFTVEPQYPEL